MKPSTSRTFALFVHEARTVRQDCKTYGQIQIKSILLPKAVATPNKEKRRDWKGLQKKKEREGKKNLEISDYFFSSLFRMTCGLNYLYNCFN